MPFDHELLSEDDFDLVETLSPLRARGPSDRHPLLAPLASAQHALTKLDVMAACASPDVAAGLRARMGFREASGWLAYSHTWISPHDLALRASHITSSYSAAAIRGDLAPALPATLASGFRLDAVPEDNLVDMAISLARHWARLAELSTWQPLESITLLKQSLEKLDCRDEVDQQTVEQWLTVVRRRDADRPALLQAAAGARGWMNLAENSADLSLDGMFMAAAIWKLKGHGRSTSLPFWAAPHREHHRLSLKTGIAWIAGFLDCVTMAAKAGLDELEKLQLVEAKAAEIGGTKRSKLPAAIRFAIRQPVITAASLAASLKITPQAASGMVKQMQTAGLIIEVTRRESWRAFVLR